MLSPGLHRGLQGRLCKPASPMDTLHGNITAPRTQGTQASEKLIFLYLEVFDSLSELRMINYSNWVLISQTILE